MVGDFAAHRAEQKTPGRAASPSADDEEHRPRRLLDEGVFVTGFGFPVVPEGTARVRVQMSAALEPEHLERAIAAFERVRPTT